MNKIISNVKYYPLNNSLPFSIELEDSLKKIEKNEVNKYYKKNGIFLMYFKSGIFVSSDENIEAIKKDLTRKVFEQYSINCFLPLRYSGATLKFEIAENKKSLGWGFRLNLKDTYFDKILSKNKEYFIKHKDAKTEDYVSLKTHLKKLISSSNWKIEDSAIELFGERNFKLLEECFRDNNDVNDFMLSFTADEKNSLADCVRMAVLVAKIQTRLKVDSHMSSNEIKIKVMSRLAENNKKFKINVLGVDEFKKCEETINISRFIGTVLLVDDLLCLDENISSNVCLKKSDRDDLFNVLFHSNSINSELFNFLDIKDPVFGYLTSSKSTDSIYINLVVVLERFKDLNLSTKEFRDSIFLKIQNKILFNLSGFQNVVKDDFSFLLVDKSLIDKKYEFMHNFLLLSSKINELNENSLPIPATLSSQFDLYLEALNCERFYFNTILSEVQSKLSGIVIENMVKSDLSHYDKEYPLLIKSSLLSEEIVPYIEDKLSMMESLVFRSFVSGKKPDLEVIPLVRKAVSLFDPVGFDVALKNKKIINGVFDSSVGNVIDIDDDLDKGFKI